MFPKRCSERGLYESLRQSRTWFRQNYCCIFTQVFNLSVEDSNAKKTKRLKSSSSLLKMDFDNIDLLKKTSAVRRMLVMSKNLSAVDSSSFNLSMKERRSDTDGNSTSRQHCQIDWCRSGRWIFASVQKSYTAAIHLIVIDECAELLDAQFLFAWALMTISGSF